MSPRLVAYRQRLKAERRERTDRLAILVSEGMSVAAAARSMGLAQASGSRMWKDIRDGLGWQAQ